MVSKHSPPIPLSVWCLRLSDLQRIKNNGEVKERYKTRTVGLYKPSRASRNVAATLLMSTSRVKTSEERTSNSLTPNLCTLLPRNAVSSSCITCSRMTPYCPALLVTNRPIPLSFCCSTPLHPSTPFFLDESTQTRACLWPFLSRPAFALGSSCRISCIHDHHKEGQNCTL